MANAKAAVPAVVVLAVLSTISGVVTTLAGTGQAPKPVAADVMPRGELEQRLGQLELRLNARLYDLRELIIRRTK